MEKQCMVKSYANYWARTTGKYLRQYRKEDVRGFAVKTVRGYYPQRGIRCEAGEEEDDDCPADEFVEKGLVAEFQDTD